MEESDTVLVCNACIVGEKREQLNIWILLCKGNSAAWSSLNSELDTEPNVGLRNCGKLILCSYLLAIFAVCCTDFYFFNPDEFVALFVLDTLRLYRWLPSASLCLCSPHYSTWIRSDGRNVSPPVAWCMFECLPFAHSMCPFFVLFLNQTGCSLSL